MSYRIEQADPLALLRELPDEWAQTCVTSPPPEAPVPYLLAVLDEVHRILRTDGTVWLLLGRGGNAHDLMWALRHTRWMRPLRASATPMHVLLLTKQPAFLFRPQYPVTRVISPQRHARPGYPVARRPRYGCGDCSMPRRAWCVPSPGAGGIPPTGVIEWCILASTVPYACEVCGAPSRQSVRRRERWHSTCTHRSGRGRCLVIDPFCANGNTGIVAIRRGRQYLGIDPNPANTANARRRLTKLLERAR
jgi:hypothetical protein